MLFLAAKQKSFLNLITIFPCILTLFLILKIHPLNGNFHNIIINFYGVNLVFYASDAFQTYSDFTFLRAENFRASETFSACQNVFDNF